MGFAFLCLIKQSLAYRAWLNTNEKAAIRMIFWNDYCQFSGEILPVENLALRN